MRDHQNSQREGLLLLYYTNTAEQGQQDDRAWKDLSMWEMLGLSACVNKGAKKK